MDWRGPAKVGFWGGTPIAVLTVLGVAASWGGGSPWPIRIAWMVAAVAAFTIAWAGNRYRYTETERAHIEARQAEQTTARLVNAVGPLLGGERVIMAAAVRVRNDLLTGLAVVSLVAAIITRDGAVVGDATDTRYLVLVRHRLLVIAPRGLRSPMKIQEEILLDSIRTVKAQRRVFAWVMSLALTSGETRVFAPEYKSEGALRAMETFLRRGITGSYATDDHLGDQ